MGLGGEVEHRAGPVAAQLLGHQRAVGDVAFNEDMARILGQHGQAVAVAGVGELVDVYQRLAGLGEPFENEIGTDETGAACDQDHGEAGKVGGAENYRIHLLPAAPGPGGTA